MRVLSPKAGSAKNPMKQFHGNTTCFICNSNKKIKNCCGKYEYISEEFEKIINDTLSKIDKDVLLMVRK